jgi:hypothetical protein
VRPKFAEDASFVDVAKALAEDAMNDLINAEKDEDEAEEKFWWSASDALKKRIRKGVMDAAFDLVKKEMLKK